MASGDKRREEREPHMSYDINLSYPESGRAQVETFAEGGTYVLGGSTDASLNVTYNYGSFYYEYLDKELGIRWLYGKQAKDTVERLQHAVEALGTERSDDYWEKTPGNAGYALSILLSWARLHPDASWSGD